jgi:hypothetical protein
VTNTGGDTPPSALTGCHLPFQGRIEKTPPLRSAAC